MTNTSEKYERTQQGNLLYQHHHIHYQNLQDSSNITFMFQFSPGLSFRFPETCLKAPETRFGIGSTQRTGHTGGPEGEPVSFKAG